MRSHSIAALASIAAVLLAGCRTAVPAYQRQQEDALAATARAYRPAGEKPALPVLRADSPLPEFIRYAVLNNPEVEATYDDWRAAVAGITPARSLPDPRLTFQADITDTLMNLMPGVMADLTTPGKRTAMGHEAAAGAEVARRAYVAAVVRTASAARKAWIELAYVEDSRALYGTTIHTIDEALALTNAAYATGQGVATLDEQTRLQNEVARHHAHHASLDDRLVAARAQFKSVLGIAPTDADPPWPVPSLAPSPLPDEADLWRLTAAANPDLAKMHAMVDMAVASVDVAQTAGTPDFSLGLMGNVLSKASNPRMARPTASVSLPIWRDKIAAVVAGATARRDAAVARVRAEEIDLAAELARALYMAREADRMLRYIDGTALPNLDRTVASLEASTQSGLTPLSAIAETRIMEIDLQHERLDALRDRENAIADLLLLTTQTVPAGTVLANR